MNTNNKNTATTATLRNEINVTVSCGWGPEIGEAFAEFARSRLQELYPNTSVIVSFDVVLRVDQINSEHCEKFSEAAVIDELRYLWNDFLDARWPGRWGQA